VGVLAVPRARVSREAARHLSHLESQAPFASYRAHRAQRVPQVQDKRGWGAFQPSRQLPVRAALCVRGDREAYVKGCDR